ncbi:MAG: hypothetical protein HRU25_07995 [Psychrobium sp.]|nr:hypothetical protein [Psychrobium sp.]
MSDAAEVFDLNPQLAERRKMQKDKGGYVLQYRNIDHQEWSLDIVCMSIAQYLIRKAVFKPCSIEYRTKTVNLNVGQFVTTSMDLATKLGVTKLYKDYRNPKSSIKKEMSRCFKWLRKTGLIELDLIQKGRVVFYIITVKNYSKYQQKTVSHGVSPKVSHGVSHESHAEQGLESSSVSHGVSAKVSHEVSLKKQEDLINNKDLKIMSNSDELNSPSQQEEIPPKNKPKSKVPYQAIWNLYKNILVNTGTNQLRLVDMQDIEGDRKRRIKQFWASHGKHALEYVEEYFNWLWLNRDSHSWVFGGGNRGWRDDIEYILRLKTFRKAQEGTLGNFKDSNDE